MRELALATVPAPPNQLAANQGFSAKPGTCHTTYLGQLAWSKLWVSLKHSAGDIVELKILRMHMSQSQYKLVQHMRSLFCEPLLAPGLRKYFAGYGPKSIVC